ncbi:hypothetical protein, partial [Mucilaginibacter sp.]
GANTGGAIFGAPGGAPVWDDGNEQDYLDYTEDQLESSDYYQAKHGNIAAIGRVYGGVQTIWTSSNGSSDYTAKDAIKGILGINDDSPGGTATSTPTSTNAPLSTIQAGPMTASNGVGYSTPFASYNDPMDTFDANQGGGNFTTPYGSGTYQLDKWSGPYSNTDPTMNYGVQMRIYFTQEGNSFKSFQWIQTYNQYVNGKASSAVDGAADPFYYTQQQLNWSSQFANAFFTDTPASNADTRSFVGYTTLVGINSNGSMTPIATFTWGYGASGTTNVIPGNVSYIIGSGGPNQYLIK